MELTGDDEPITGAGIAPILSLVARSLAGDLELLPLPSIRALVVLSHGHSLSMRDLADALSLRIPTVLTTVDSLERDGWIYTAVHARGVAERVAITAKGRELVDRMTARREDEIKAVLGRMPDADRTQVAQAFASFAAAAGEPSVTRPRKGIAP